MAQAENPAGSQHLGDFTKMLEQFEVLGIDMTAFIEALAQANKVAYESMQALVRTQAEILRVTFEESRSASEKTGKVRDPEVAAGQPTEFIEQAVQKALATIREVAEMAVKAHTEAGIIGDRAMQNVEIMKKLMQPR